MEHILLLLTYVNDNCDFNAVIRFKLRVLIALYYFLCRLYLIFLSELLLYNRKTIY